MSESQKSLAARLSGVAAVQGWAQPGEQHKNGVERGVQLRSGRLHGSGCSLELVQQVGVQQGEPMEELRTCDGPLWRLTLHDRDPLLKMASKMAVAAP